MPSQELEDSLPSARKTYDGSKDAEVQALPDERAMSYGMMISRTFTEIDKLAHFQRHEETLTLHIRETQVDTPRITVRIAIPHNVFNLCIDF